MSEEKDKQPTKRNILLEALHITDQKAQGFIVIDTDTLTRVFVSHLQISTTELREIVERRESFDGLPRDYEELDTEQKQKETPIKKENSVKPLSQK